MNNFEFCNPVRVVFGKGMIARLSALVPSDSKVLMVYAPREVRIARAIERDSSSRELIEQRIRSQMDDEVKRRQADFVIVNDGEKALIPQVRELLASL